MRAGAAFLESEGLQELYNLGAAALYRHSHTPQSRLTPRVARAAPHRPVNGMRKSPLRLLGVTVHSKQSAPLAGSIARSPLTMVGRSNRNDGEGSTAGATVTATADAMAVPVNRASDANRLVDDLTTDYEGRDDMFGVESDEQL